MDTKQRQKGFTLIEIIAVIVLLGVLAAVLVPKFTNLTADARKQALMQAIAEGQARVNAAAARFILSVGSVPTAYTQVSTDTALSSDAGDYVLSFGAAAGSGVNITARYAAAASSTISTTGSAAFPQ